MAANASGASSDHDDLLAAPVILVRLPIVQGPVRQPAIEPAGDTKEEQGAHAGEGRVVQDGEVLAARGEAGGQQESSGKEGVEGNVAKQLDNDIAFEPLAGDETIVHRHLAIHLPTKVGLWW